MRIDAHARDYPEACINNLISLGPFDYGHKASRATDTAAKAVEFARSLKPQVVPR